MRAAIASDGGEPGGVASTQLGRGEPGAAAVSDSEDEGTAIERSVSRGCRLPAQGLESVARDRSLPSESIGWTSCLMSARRLPSQSSCTESSWWTLQVGRPARCGPGGRQEKGIPSHASGSHRTAERSEATPPFRRGG
jgi:hypothetical protein